MDPILGNFLKYEAVFFSKNTDTRLPDYTGAAMEVS